MRVPEQVVGDLFAQVAAIEVCQERVREFLADAGLDDLEALAAAIQQHGEQSMRAAIRAIPDGVYDHAFEIDGFDTTLTVRCRITVEDERLDVDYAGTSPQVPHGINSPMSYTYAYTKYPLKCALDPLTPKNEGSYRPLSVQAPAGSILNATFPAPVSARHLTGMYCAAAVFGASRARSPTASWRIRAGRPRGRCSPVSTGTASPSA